MTSSYNNARHNSSISREWYVDVRTFTLDLGVNLKFGIIMNLRGKRIMADAASAPMPMAVR